MLHLLRLHMLRLPLPPLLLWTAFYGDGRHKEIVDEDGPLECIPHAFEV